MMRLVCFSVQSASVVKGPIRGHSTTTWTEFCHFSTPCVDSFYTLSVDKNIHFLTPSPPHLVHIVNEWPPRVEARGWAVQRTYQLRQEHHYNTRGKLHSKDEPATRAHAPYEKNLERREPTAGATWNWKACAHRCRCSGVVAARRTFVQRVRFVQKQF